MSYYAGLDWSGKPFPEVRASGLLVPCSIIVNDLEGLNADFSQYRRLVGLPQTAEFHGHKMSPQMIADVLDLGKLRQVRTGALLMGLTMRAEGVLPNPVTLETVALALLKQFLRQHPVLTLWYDPDIDGQQRQKAFETAIRHLHPGAKRKIQPRASHKSNLIQLADVTAYALSWQARKSKLHPAIHKCLDELRANEENLIIGPIPWGTDLE